MQRFLSEFLGTYALVFAGTGAIVIDAASGGAISHVGVALTFGLVVMAMISTFGDVSGAHFNPAVSIAFCAAGRLPARELAPYIAAQCAGAFAASLLLRLLFPESTTLGATLPAGLGSAGANLAGQSFVLEAVLAAILMLVILAVSSGSKEKGITAGIAIGATVALEAMFAGPISGASMNPARSLAPAVVSGQTAHLWVYLAAPVVGALVAVPLARATVLAKSRAPAA